MDFGFIITSGIQNGLIWALMCLGVYISYRILDLADLGVEGTFPLGACVGALLIYLGVPPIIATVLAIAAGAGVGAITGILHTKLKIPAILSGIITMTGLYTINLVVLGFSSNESSTKNSLPITNTIFKPIRSFFQNIDKTNVEGFRIAILVIFFVIVALLVVYLVLTLIKTINNWKKDNFKKVPNIIFMSIAGLVALGLLVFELLLIIPNFGLELAKSLMNYTIKNASDITVIGISGVILIVVFAFCYWFFGTEIGMSLRATGNNQRMAKAQGINTSAMIIMGLAISNGLVALSGAIFAQNLGNSNIEMGRGVIVIGLASVIIGEAIFGKRDFKRALISVIVGSVIYYILNAIAIELNVTNYLKLVSSILIVVILTIPLIKKSISHHKKINHDGGVANA